MTIAVTPYTCAHITDDGRCVWHTRTWSPACSPKRCAECPDAETAPERGLLTRMTDAAIDSTDRLVEGRSSFGERSIPAAETAPDCPVCAGECASKNCPMERVAKLETALKQIARVPTGFDAIANMRAIARAALSRAGERA